MRNGQLGLLGVFLTAALATGSGCGNGNGGDATAGTSTTSAGTPNNNVGGSPSTGGVPSGGAGAPAASCSNVTPCGGDVQGSWTVTSSCLKLSGDMDVTLTSLGCATVPVTGSLTTTGSFIAKADGTFVDNTVTTGMATFPLAKNCLSISSVDRTCEEVSDIFTSVGWKTGSCVTTNGQCNCTVTAEQHGGLGAISGVSTASGRYSTSNNSLTTEDTSAPYCVANSTLTVTPTSPGVSGTILLTKDASSGGTGGMPSTGGSAGAPAGGTGMGGANGGTTSGGSAGGGSLGGSGQVGNLPCDIYAAANTACVAAHSTVRALLSAYTGNLYQIKRADGMTKDIPVGPGGFADSAQQDTFCSGTTCTIMKVYDQSGHGNNVEAEIPGLVLGTGANAKEGHSGMTAANAMQESLMVGGHKVYSLYTKQSQAYWRDGSATGIPKGTSPQGIYMVTSGTHTSGGCCYDYGNGEVSRTYVAGNSMDALYFGTDSAGWALGEGAGPWVMADLEGGIFAGLDAKKTAHAGFTSLPFAYVTAMEKNNGTSDYALKGADATKPTLSTFYQGKLPGGKEKSAKQGSIVLGSGGDCCYSNNNASAGTFYEGAIVAGYPSDATDAAIHANIVSTGYGK